MRLWTHCLVTLVTPTQPITANNLSLLWMTPDFPLAPAPWAKMRIALPAAPQPRSLGLGTVDHPAELHLPILGLLLQIFPTSGYETIA